MEDRSDMGFFAIVPLWLAEALKDQTQGMSALMVWVVMHRWMNHETKRAWPTVESIAKAAGMSERAVHRSIELLRIVQALDVNPRYGPDGGNLSNEYFMYFAKPVGGVARVRPPGGSTGATPGVAPVAPKLEPLELDPLELYLPPQAAELSQPRKRTMRKYDDGSDIRPLNRTEEEHKVSSRPGAPSTRLRRYFEEQWRMVLSKRPRLDGRVAMVASPVEAFQKNLKLMLKVDTEERIQDQMDRFFRDILNERVSISSEYPLWQQFLTKRKGSSDIKHDTFKPNV
jgi:hypothetical protein